MKFGQVFVQHIANIASLSLILMLKVETSFRPFCDFDK